MRALKFTTDHVIYKPAYTYKFQLKTMKTTQGGAIFFDTWKTNMYRAGKFKLQVSSHKFGEISRSDWSSVWSRIPDDSNNTDASR